MRQEECEKVLTNRFKILSVLLNISDPWYLMPSVWCRLVIVKLRVKSSRDGLVPAAEKRKWGV